MKCFASPLWGFSQIFYSYYAPSQQAVLVSASQKYFQTCHEYNDAIVLFHFYRTVLIDLQVCPKCYSNLCSQSFYTFIKFFVTSLELSFKRILVSRYHIENWLKSLQKIRKVAQIILIPGKTTVLPKGW